MLEKDNRTFEEVVTWIKDNNREYYPETIDKETFDEMNEEIIGYIKAQKRLEVIKQEMLKKLDKLQN